MAESRWGEDKTEPKEWWEDTKPIQKPITHYVVEKIYSIGDVKDPITGKMVVGEHYRDHINRASKLYEEGNSAKIEKFSVSLILEITAYICVTFKELLYNAIFHSGISISTY